MLSGRQALAELSRALEDVRRDANRHDSAYQQASQALARNELIRSTKLRELARLRLAAESDDADPGWYSALEQAEAQARKLLEQRELEQSEVSQRIEQAQLLIDNTEAAREARHEAVEQAARALAEQEAAVQQALDVDPVYQAQLADSRRLTSTLAQAEKKAAVAATDRAQKGRPYEEDPLFIYLWNRGYGTSEYTGSGLFRFLDGWVAGICAYNEARVQYWTLNEIPARLQAHADDVEERADEALAQLAELEAQAGDQAALPALREQLLAAEAAQDAADADLERAEDALRELSELRSQFTLGTDQYMRESLAVMTEAFRAESTSSLLDLARQTPDARDDILVRELEDLRDAEEDLQAELQEQQAVRTRVTSQTHELENLRRRFKMHRFDDLRSSFGNEQLIRTVLREFLQGATSGAGVWDTLRRQQRYRDVAGAWPDFGSAGLPRPRRRSAGRGNGWHWPGGRSGGFKLPRSGGSRSRGGFRTGGGF